MDLNNNNKKKNRKIYENASTAGIESEEKIGKLKIEHLKLSSQRSCKKQESKGVNNVYGTYGIPSKESIYTLQRSQKERREGQSFYKVIITRKFPDQWRKMYTQNHEAQ